MMGRGRVTEQKPVCALTKASLPLKGSENAGATQPAGFSDPASGTTPLLAKGVLRPLDDLWGGISS